MKIKKKYSLTKTTNIYPPILAFFLSLKRNRFLNVWVLSCLFVCFFLPTFVFSSKVLPNCDVVFYKNDTLLIDKIFSDVILKKMKKQPHLMYCENPLKVNCYTAFWQISDHGISLVKVTNQNAINWKNFKQTDSLDLQKAFGKRYQNGQVLFQPSKRTFYLHKPLILRNHWGWFPTYLEDYTIQFSKNKWISCDTSANYKDDPTRLNRYSRVQLDESIFHLLKDSVQIIPSIIQAKRIEFSISVTIKNSGDFDTLELSSIRVTDLSDSVYLYVYPDSIVQTKNLFNILINIQFDEINTTNKDEAMVSFEYDFLERKLTHLRFSEYLEKEQKFVFDRLPWYVEKRYHNKSM